MKTIIALAILWVGPSVAKGLFDNYDAQRAEEVLQSTKRISDAQKQLKSTPEPKQGVLTARIVDETRRIDAIVAEEPSSPLVQNAGAAASLQLGDTKTARARADIAVGLATAKGDPQLLARALITRALTAAAERNYSAAEADAREALKAEPGNEAAQAVVKLTQARSRVRTKLDASLEKPLAEDEPLQAAMALARAKAAITRPAGFTASVDLTKRAETGLKLADYERMRDAATAALAKLPNNPRAYMDRAFANLMLKRYDEVVADAGAGLKLRPDSYSLLSLRAAGQLEKGRPREAFADAEKAVKLNPKDAFSWVQRGLASERLGATEAAYLADLKNAAELDPAFDHYYTEALARRGLAPAAKHEAAPSMPWWARPGTLVAGLGLLVILLVVGVAILLRPEAPRRAGVIGGCFKLGKMIGRGGMGAVYEAWDENLERAVAVKRMHEALRDDAKEAARFVQEAKTVASLKHQGIVSIYDAFQDGGELYLVFELVGGETLDGYLERRGGALEPADALRLLGPVCEALDYAHARGVIHRDLKPSNVMIEDGRPKIMDFGIARRTRAADRRTLTRTIAGTPSYMAPEAERGEVSTQTDLYALGVCAYRMLTGEMPFEAPAGPFDDVLKRAMDPQPSRRFRSAAEFFSALRDAVPA